MVRGLFINDWRGGDSRAFAIVRVSSERQRDNTSHETQESEIRSYCASQGLELERVFKIVESAKQGYKRKQYLSAIDQALRSKVHHIVFYMYDRETRNLSDNESNEALVQAGKIVLHYARERKVLHRGSADSDFYIRDISAATSKQFIRTLKTKVIDSMRAKAESGWFPGNRPPLGYVHKRVKDEHGRELRRGTIISPDADKTSLMLVRREFELRANGLSYEAIRDRCLEEKIVPIRLQRNYCVHGVEARLKNIFYWGKFTWAGQVYDGKHELIIPRTHLELVERSFRGRKNSRSPEEQGIFSGGWLTCGECGCNIVYDPKKKLTAGTGQVKTYDYYHCTNGKRLHEKIISVTEDSLWKQLHEAVEKITITEDLASRVASELNLRHVNNMREIRFALGAAEHELKLLDSREDSVYDDYKNGILDENSYHRQTMRIRDDRKQITTKVSQLNALTRGAGLKNALFILELSKRAESLWIQRSKAERLRLLENLLSNRFLSGARVGFTYRSHFDAIAQMVGSENWRTKPALDRTTIQVLADNLANISEAINEKQLFE